MPKVGLPLNHELAQRVVDLCAEHFAVPASVIKTGNGRKCGEVIGNARHVSRYIIDKYQNCTSKDLSVFFGVNHASVYNSIDLMKGVMSMRMPHPLHNVIRKIENELLAKEYHIAIQETVKESKRNSKDRLSVSLKTLTHL